MNCHHSKSSHDHRVEDTRLRSLGKGATGYILEVLADTFVIAGGISLLLGAPTETALSSGLIFAIITEGLCFMTHYINDRLWNRIQWGRRVIDIARKQHKR